MDDKKRKIPIKTRIYKTLKKWLMVILNPKLLLCLFIAWMITNGWSYVFTALGTALDITWMTVAGTAYMGLLWVPFTPEKILTVIIAMFLMRTFFPRDKKTIAVLREELLKLKNAYRKGQRRRQKLRALRKAGRQNGLVKEYV